MSGTRIVITTPTPGYAGRTFEAERRATLEVRAKNSVQDRYLVGVWKMRAGREGILEVDCWIVETADGPVAIPCALCEVTP